MARLADNKEALSPATLGKGMSETLFVQENYHAQTGGHNMQTRVAGRNCTYRAAQFPQEQMGHLYPLHMNTYLWETSTNYIMEYKLHLHGMYYLRKPAANHMQGSAVYPGGGMTSLSMIRTGLVALWVKGPALSPHPAGSTDVRHSELSPIGQSALVTVTLVAFTRLVKATIVHLGRRRLTGRPAVAGIRLVQGSLQNRTRDPRKVIPPSQNTQLNFPQDGCVQRLCSPPPQVALSVHHTLQQLEPTGELNWGNIGRGNNFKLSRNQQPQI